MRPQSSAPTVPISPEPHLYSFIPARLLHLIVDHRLVFGDPFVASTWMDSFLWTAQEIKHKTNNNLKNEPQKVTFGEEAGGKIWLLNTMFTSDVSLCISNRLVDCMFADGQDGAQCCIQRPYAQSRKHGYSLTAMRGANWYPHIGATATGLVRQTAPAPLHLCCTVRALVKAGQHKGGAILDRGKWAWGGQFLAGHGQAQDSAAKPNPKPKQEAARPQFGPRCPLGFVPAI